MTQRRNYCISSYIIEKPSQAASFLFVNPNERLSIQVHPDKTFSKTYFHSNFGKTECWHIITTRELQQENPYILLGFAPSVTRELWKEYYEKQDIESMKSCLNKC